jgi:hypothetical protein
VARDSAPLSPTATSSHTECPSTPCRLAGAMPESTPEIRRTPAWCKRATKSHRACSICWKVTPIRSIAALIAAGGSVIRSGSIPMVGQTAIWLRVLDQHGGPGAAERLAVEGVGCSDRLHV